MKHLRRLSFDLLFLWRYGFIYAYLFVAAVYGALLVSLPAGLFRLTAGMALVYSDIAMLGFIFMGASLHLEVESGTVAALGVSPAAPGVIIMLRVLSMTLVSISIALILMLVAGGSRSNLPLFLLGAVSCAATYSCFGISLMSRTENLTRYLLLSGILTLPSGIPLIGFFLGGGVRFSALFPGAGGLGLMCVALRGVSWNGGPGIPAAAANILFWGGAAFLCAERDFRLRIVGGKKSRHAGARL